MKIIKVVAENVPLFNEKIEIDFFAEGRVSQDEKHELIHLFDKYYANRTLTFAGLNASGKTQVLNVLLMTFNILQAQSINYNPSLSLRNTIHNNMLHLEEGDTIKITVYFYVNSNLQKLCKLESYIARKFDNSLGEYKYYFVDESLMTKGINGIRAKGQLFDFSHADSSTIQRQDQQQMFLGLSEDISIIQVFYQLNHLDRFVYKDTLSLTNFNLIHNYSHLPIELIRYLDPSIEKLEFIQNPETNAVKIKLKFFYSKSEINLNSIIELSDVLSSGTIKGISLFMTAFQMLKQGGILVVDELENHLNREIVSTFLHFFLDRKRNPNGAVLIYSTHYSELLDIIQRNDSIYIMNKHESINIEKFSNLIKRNDISKSDIFVKGIINHTTPSYRLEHDLVRAVKSSYLGDVDGR